MFFVDSLILVERSVCQAVVPTIDRCSSHIIRLKEEAFLYQRFQVQVPKGSTFLMSGYSTVSLSSNVKLYFSPASRRDPPPPHTSKTPQPKQKNQQTKNNPTTSKPENFFS